MSSRPTGAGPDRTRLVLVILASLIVVGVVVGLVLAWLSTRALEAAGVDEAGQPVLTSPPPDGAAASGGSAVGPSGPDGASASAGSGSTTATRPTPTRVTTTSATQSSLVASATSTGTFERITLTGRLAGVPAGTTLQVERREGGSWVEFPVTASTTTADGSFTTYVELGQLGANVLRVTLPGSSLATPPVTVTVS